VCVTVSSYYVVKRGRTDAGEVRRLQNRLRALEQVNEALRAEVTILHQLAPPPPAVTNNTQSAHDTNIGTSITSEEKLDKSTSVEVRNETKNSSRCIKVEEVCHNTVCENAEYTFHG
jgi:histidyl-tRNA synthetase